MILRFLLGDRALLDQHLYVAVVSRTAKDLSAANLVDTAVSDVRPVRSPFLHQAHGAGRPGPEIHRHVAAEGHDFVVGARECPLVSLSMAPHVYYVSPSSHVSVFVVPRHVRFDDAFGTKARGDSVRLLRVEGEVVGIVGGREADVRAVESAIRPVMAAWLRSDPSVLLGSPGQRLPWREAVHGSCPDEQARCVPL